MRQRTRNWKMHCYGGSKISRKDSFLSVGCWYVSKLKGMHWKRTETLSLYLKDGLPPSKKGTDWSFGMCAGRKQRWMNVTLMVGRQLSFLSTWLVVNLPMCLMPTKQLSFSKPCWTKQSCLRAICALQGKGAKKGSFVLSSNMLGMEYLPLLVIGKANHPRCFKNTRHLPEDCQANRKARMTSNIFQAWLRQLDCLSFANKHEVLLAVVNCSMDTQCKEAGVHQAHVPTPKHGVCSATARSKNNSTRKKQVQKT